MKLRNQEIENRIAKLKAGDAFEAIHSNQKFLLERKIEKQAGKKLPEPLFVWKYLDSEKTFTNRVEDVRRALLYKNWIKYENL